MCYLHDFSAETELMKSFMDIFWVSCSFKCESGDFGADEQIQKHFQVKLALFVVKVQAM